MTPTAAAHTSQTSAPSLRDRLKDSSLLREQCYIDGAWTGTPANPVTNPVNGVELAKVPKLGTADGRESQRERKNDRGEDGPDHSGQKCFTDDGLENPIRRRDQRTGKWQSFQLVRFEQIRRTSNGQIGEIKFCKRDSGCHCTTS